MKTLLTAAHVAPMDGPVRREWGLVVEGEQIAALGPIPEMRRRHPDAVVIDLGNAVILPGLVNAHTHIELTSVGRLPRPASFVDWILALCDRMGAVDDVERFVRESTAAGLRQCLQFGVTSVGDITLNPAVTRPILAASNLGGVSFGEVLGMAGRSAQLEGRLAAALDRRFETQRLRVGIEPHAPYSIDLTGYERCVAAARAGGLPLATHLAETSDEAAFLRDHSGEFRRLWEALGGWSEGVSTSPGGPVRALADVGFFERPSLLAHVNYVDDEEIAILARNRASVVYCPRTHAYFGHPRHRFTEMIERGVNVAIGTDSAASAGDLNLVDELRTVHRARPEVAVETLWRMATLDAATVLGSDRTGRLAMGAAADLCVFDSVSGEPLREILETTVLPREVWLAGVRIEAEPDQAAAP